jgi:hypothetical protein
MQNNSELYFHFDIFIFLNKVTGGNARLQWKLECPGPGRLFKITTYNSIQGDFNGKRESKVNLNNETSLPERAHEKILAARFNMFLKRRVYNM